MKMITASTQWISLICLLTVSSVQAAPHQLGYFGSDVTQRVMMPGVLDKEMANFVMQSEFDHYGKEAGLLTDQASDLELRVFVDYFRHYWGEGTPFPIGRFANSKFRYKIHVRHNGKLVDKFTSQVRVINPKDHDGLAHVDIGQLKFIARQALLKTMKMTGEGDPSVVPKLVSTAEIEVFAKTYDLIKPSVNISQQYIPEAEVDRMIQQLEAADSDGREDIYAHIIKSWYNTPKLFAWIENYVTQHYRKPESRQYDNELELALKAISSSGMVGYQAFLEKVSTQAYDDDVRDTAKRQIKTLTLRNQQGAYVHSVSDVKPEQNWQSIQRVNLINSPDVKQQYREAKLQVRAKEKDPHALEALRLQLLKVATKDTFRSSYSINFHGMATRALASSGDRRFLKTLNLLAKEAHHEKVRDWAKKFAKQLD